MMMCGGTMTPEPRHVIPLGMYVCGVTEPMTSVPVQTARAALRTMGTVGNTLPGEHALHGIV